MHEQYTIQAVRNGLWVTLALRDSNNEFSSIAKANEAADRTLDDGEEYRLVDWQGRITGYWKATAPVDAPVEPSKARVVLEWSTTLYNKDDGPHQMRMVATDAAGNWVAERLVVWTDALGKEVPVWQHTVLAVGDKERVIQELVKKLANGSEGE